MSFIATLSISNQIQPEETRTMNNEIAMGKEIGQKFIGKNRAPRVQIEYDVQSS